MRLSLGQPDSNDWRSTKNNSEQLAVYWRKKANGAEHPPGRKMYPIVLSYSSVYEIQRLIWRIEVLVHMITMNMTITLVGTLQAEHWADTGSLHTCKLSGAIKIRATTSSSNLRRSTGVYDRAFCWRFTTSENSKIHSQRYRCTLERCSELPKQTCLRPADTSSERSRLWTKDSSKGIYKKPRTKRKGDKEKGRFNPNVSSMEWI